MKKLLFLLAIPLFVACSSPMSKKYSRETVKDDITAIRESKELDSTEMNLLASQMVKNMLSGSSMDGKTYAQILEEAKADQAVREEKERLEQEEEAKAQKEQEAKLGKLNEALGVSLKDKGYEKGDFQEYITYKFAFQNKSAKKIKAFTGRVVFKDLFGKEITKLELTYDKGIEANEVKDYDANTDYNEFLDSDQLLLSKEMDQIEMQWVPEKILFEDGTSLQ